MSHLVAKEAPDFTATAVMGNNSFNEDFTLSSLRGKYVVLFFYPLDFTFVCPSEILAFDERLEDFKKRGAEVVAVSVDSPYTHLAWKRTAVEAGGIGPIGYPIVSDVTKSISFDYGVLLEKDGVALRGLFLIDKSGIVRHALVNDLSLGRSIPEAIRMLDALRFVDEHGDVCPANWELGQEAMKPTTQGVVDYLSKYAKKKTAAV
jgi:peroxiredoxin (alkyl hydroperoxide reductase subunit C)